MSRRSPRLPARFAATAQIPGRDTTLVCHTRDISAEGCFLDTTQRLAVGTHISLAILDNAVGEVVEVTGVVMRCLTDASDGSVRGVGLRIEDPPDGWVAMIARYESAHEEEGRPAMRLQVLVVGDENKRRGALALYVTSGWDLRFATDVDAAREALEALPLDAVIAEHDLADQRWAEVLATARRIQPNTRRIVRTSLRGGSMPTHGRKEDLVHRVVDLDAGLDALVDALTADLALRDSEPTPTA